MFARYSTLKFIPDPLGDLLFDGIAQAAFKKDVAGGVQAEGVLHVGEAHTVRAGLIGEIDRSTSDTSSQVIPLDPVTHSQTSDQPKTIVDDGGQTAKTIKAPISRTVKPRQPDHVNTGLLDQLTDSARRNPAPVPYAERGPEERPGRRLRAPDLRATLTAAVLTWSTPKPWQVQQHHRATATAR